MPAKGWQPRPPLPCCVLAASGLPWPSAGARGRPCTLPAAGLESVFKQRKASAQFGKTQESTSTAETQFGQPLFRKLEEEAAVCCAHAAKAAPPRRRRQRKARVISLRAIGRRRHGRRRRCSVPAKSDVFERHFLPTLHNGTMAKSEGHGKRRRPRYRPANKDCGKGKTILRRHEQQFAGLCRCKRKAVKITIVLASSRTTTTGLPLYHWVKGKRCFRCLAAPTAPYGTAGDTGLLCHLAVPTLDYQ